MYRLLQVTVAVVLVGMMVIGPVNAAPAARPPSDATVGGGCTESDLDTALGAGGAITFNCGGSKTITLTSAKTISQDTTIDGGDVITLTGGLSTRLFVVDSGVTLELDHLLLDGAASGGSDGGAIANHGSLVIDNSTIRHSQTDLGHSGGAIFSDGPVTLTSSRLVSNSAGAGGAIYLQAPASLAIAGGHVDDNSAAADGGALYLAPGTRADIEPGPLSVPKFRGNLANHSGGAIFNQGGAVNMVGGDFEDNRALTTSVLSSYGGAIDDQGVLSVFGSLFENNDARWGGALYVGGAGPTATAAISLTAFFNNNAVEFGGGLYTDAALATVSLESARFDGNQASVGGGMARTNANLSISRSSFTLNQAQLGGGLYAQGRPNPSSAGNVEVRDSTFAKNMAGDMHSGAVDNSALLDLHNVTLKENQGGVFDESGAVARLESTALDNVDFNNCGGDATAPVTAGHNLATDLTCNLSAGAGDQAGVVSGLDNLAAGDPLVFTEYFMPEAGSLLIHNGGPDCRPADQRYATRLGACDIGAVEFGGLIPELYLPLLQR